MSLRRVRGTGTAIALLALLALPTGAALLGVPLIAAPEAVVVGYAPGEAEEAIALLASLGATVTERIDALDALVVEAPLGLDPIARLASATGAIRHVERVLGTTLDAAQWDGAQWDAAQWDGAQWDGVIADDRVDAKLALAWQWGLLAIDAPAAWEHEDGAPATSACIIDSGIRPHPDLPAPVATFNAVGGSSSVYDEAGHGTHMAGIVAATRDDGWGISGVSSAELLVAKIFDANGRGKDSDLARALVWCADRGADVALLALSVDSRSQLVARALDYALARNVVVVASSGNTGGAVTFPATEPGVIAVSAVGPLGATPTFSSRGPEVDLAAPGVRVLSTFGSSAYAYGSGTSQAAAFAAGAALVVLAAHPDLAPSSVRAALVASATDLGVPGRDDATGAGLLDVPQAVAAASTFLE